MGDGSQETRDGSWEMRDEREDMGGGMMGNRIERWETIEGEAEDGRQEMRNGEVIRLLCLRYLYCLHAASVADPNLF